MTQTAFPGKTEHHAVPWEGERWSKRPRGLQTLTHTFPRAQANTKPSSLRNDTLSPKAEVPPDMA